MSARSGTLLAVEGLRIEAGAPGAAVPLVDGLSFSVAAGEVLGIVGESGSGKSMSAYAIAGLLPAGVRVAGGRMELEGRSLDALPAAERRRLAGDRIGMVFQDPLSSFNPVRTIGAILRESVLRHQRVGAREARERVVSALADVRLPHPEALANAYPHQLSGGQRQRAMIALALLNDPALLIADEPTTALDATVQLQILALLARGAAGRATVLITHDLGVAAGLCHRILVMYGGRCLEQGPADRILATPEHPYTRRLLAAATSLGRPAEEAVP